MNKNGNFTRLFEEALCVIQIVLILLKLFGHSTMSWWIVFIPSYILLGLLLLGVIVIAILAIIFKEDIEKMTTNITLSDIDYQDDNKKES